MDDLSTRMRRMEADEADRRLDPTRPVVVRLDGVSFSTLTRSMSKPFDARLSEAMVAVAREVVTRHGAAIAFTVSDEVTAVWDAPSGKGVVMPHAGRPAKLASVLAGLASSVLTLRLAETMPRHATMHPHFDGKAFSATDREEAANAVLARFHDGRRNAVSMAARAVFTHQALVGVPSSGQREMLAGRGIDFDAYPEAFRHGTFVRRRRFERTLTAEELAAMPPRARVAGPVVRSEVAAVAMPCPFDGLANRVGFVLDGEEPVEGRHDTVEAAA